MSKKVFFMSRNADYVLDSMRSTLGLAVENMYSFNAVVNVEIPELDDYNKENLEWIRDMEGEVYSNVDANVEKNDMAKISIDELGQKLRDMEVIVPYGIL
jgi:hypothetical protein